MKKIITVFSLVIMGLFWSCVSNPPAAGNTITPAASEVKDVLKTMKELKEAALAAFDTNHPVEALRNLVAITALDSEAPPEADRARAAERKELVRKADSDLTALGARFTMEAADAWMADGKQLHGNIRQLVKGTGPMPAIRLIVNYDTGKAVVADAPVAFTFVEGTGNVTSSGTTDSYGMAQASVRAVTETDKPLLIRATLAVTSRGKTRVFNEVYREFTYLPSVRSVRVLALEREIGSDKKAASAASYSGLVDAVIRGLKNLQADCLPADGLLDPALFTAAQQGDKTAIAKLLTSDKTPVSFLAIASSDYDPPRQMVVNGKAFEIYTSIVRVSFRLLRADGTVVESRPILSVKGQGGTPALATQSGLKAAREAIEQDLQANAAAIKAKMD